MKYKETTWKERGKFFILKCKRYFHLLTKGLASKISFILLLFSVFVSLAILIPNCLDRTPVFSYFITEFDLPLTYKLTGNIKVIDSSNCIITRDIELFVGGYSATPDVNGDFELTFSSPKTDEVFATIRYKNAAGETIETTKKIALQNEEHTISKEFIIHA